MPIFHLQTAYYSLINERTKNNMKIMTANLCSWGDGFLSIPNRAPRVEYIINKYSPDLLGVQESLEYWSNFLNSKFKAYSCIGFAREENNTGEASHILYKKDLFILESESTFWLSETPSQLSLGWDGRCRRICTYGIFTYRGKKIAHFNTHLDHMGEIAQVEGAKLVIKTIQDINLPTILTGDFNVDSSSEAYKVVNQVLNDCRYLTEHSNDDYTYNGYKDEISEEVLSHKNAPDYALIDHIFISKEFKCNSYNIITEKVDNEFVSDHFFVTADIDFV